MELEFHTLDVFTAEPLGGNPLAVVLGAEGLGDRLMQQVAREFNLSETVFVLDAKEHAPDAVPVRIFTPRSEMPFAGHPVIGTGVLLAELRHKDGCPFETGLTLATKAGPVPLTVTRIAGAARAQLTAPRLAVGKETGFTDAAIAAALGLAPAQIGCARHRPQVLAGAAPILAVPVADTEALGKAAVVNEAWQPVRTATGSIGVCAYTALGRLPLGASASSLPTKGLSRIPPPGWRRWRSRRRSWPSMHRPTARCVSRSSRGSRWAGRASSTSRSTSAPGHRSRFGWQARRSESRPEPCGFERSGNLPHETNLLERKFGGDSTVSDGMLDSSQANYWPEDKK